MWKIVAIKMLDGSPEVALFRKNEKICILDGTYTENKKLCDYLNNLEGGLNVSL